MNDTCPAPFPAATATALLVPQGEPYDIMDATNTSIPTRPTQAQDPLIQATADRDDSTNAMLRPRRAGGTHLRRKSSHVERWLDEQHRMSLTEGDVPAGDEPADTKSHLTAASFCKRDGDDRATLESYVLVDNVQARAPRDAAASPATSPDATPHPSPPSTPRKASPLRQTSARLNTPSPLKNFHLTFGTRRSSAASTIASSQSATPPPPWSQRQGDDADQSHSRGSSFSTLYAMARSERNTSPELLSSRQRSPPVWKLKRPSSPDRSSPAHARSGDMAPPRPSLSSSLTQSSVTSVARSSIDAPGLSRKLTFGSVRATSPSHFSASSPSLWSLPIDASHMYDPPESTKVIAQDKEKAGTVRIPLSLKASGNGTGLGAVAGVLSSPKAKKKRKLIIGGIHPQDERRFEAARRWCERFGEVSSFARVPNGDIYVDFRKAEVAETVCRVKARVYIDNVGSVCLSYFTGKRP